jgi:rhodanese-related sulfurtransferase
MTIKQLLFLILAASLVLFSACSEDSPTEPEEESFDEFALVAAVGDIYYTEYPSTVNITMDVLFENLTDGDTSDDPFIIDWRAAAEYDVRHIKGAVNLVLGDLVAKVDDGTIPSDKTIVNVCYSGQTASIATATLNMLGYDAQNLKFGMCYVTDDTDLVPKSDKWTSQTAVDEYNLVKTGPGVPTTAYDFPNPDTGEESAEAIIKANFSKVIEGWSIASATVTADPDAYHILNYWGALDYNDIGHIEDAYQYTPKLALKSDELLNTLPTDKTIVVYCWTGQTSAQVTAYLRILGYDAKSMLYGVNGCAYTALPEGKPAYHAPDPSDKYISILEPEL